MVVADEVWSFSHSTDIFLESPVRKAAWYSGKNTLVMDVLINSMVGLLFQCLYISNHHFVHFKYVKMYYNFICQ